MLNENQKDLIFGTLLGDGNLQTENYGKTWRYRAVQKESDYLNHKYQILKPLCGSPPKLGEVLDIRTNKIYRRYYFNTLTHSSLLFYANLFYKYDKKNSKWFKDVPKKLNLFLTPRALAYLYMDDGALKWLGHSNAMRICTENFSPEGVQRIQKVLEKRYKILTTLTKTTLSNGSVGYRIYIPEKSSLCFSELIKPYLVDCMKYKVSNGN